jgi:hypothetical protein
MATDLLTLQIVNNLVKTPETIQIIPIAAGTVPVCYT